MKKRNEEESQLLINLGKQVKKARMLLGMSQQTVANLCDSDKAAICRLESGKSNPMVLTLQRLSGILNVPMATLLVSGPSSTCTTNIF